MSKSKVSFGAIVGAPACVMLWLSAGSAAPAPPGNKPGDVNPPPSVDALRCPSGYSLMSPWGSGSRGCYRRIDHEDCARSAVGQGVRRATLMVDAETEVAHRDVCKVVYDSGAETTVAPRCSRAGDIPAAPGTVQGPDLCTGDTSKARPKPPTP